MLLEDEETEAPSTVQPRATDFLSAAVENRARAASAIVSGEPVSAAVKASKAPAQRRATRTHAMEVDEDGGVALRPTRPPVQPISKAELMPSVKISAQQEQILSRLQPPAPAAPPAQAPSREAAPDEAPPVTPAPKSRAPPAPTGARRTRAVEVPEPGEAPRPRREFYQPEWDRYYNPGFFTHARAPRMAIQRNGAEPGAPAWTLIGRPKGAGVVPTSQAPYRASLKEGARVKDSKPQREVAKFVKARGSLEEADLEGPAEVPEEPGAEAPGDAPRHSEFERAMADLERSFQEGAAAGTPALRAPARGPTAAAAASTSASAAAVANAAERAMPFPRTSTTSPPARALGRASKDMADEDEAEIGAQDEEEETLGRQPPPDRSAEGRAHRTLQHDASGAALCPTCGRRITPSNQVMVCTSCSRVACASCGKFSGGEPTGNIYQYEYKFNFPLCQPCFERHFNIQKNLARSKAYLASGNLTYAFYHAQTAMQLQPDSPYAGDAQALVNQVESRKVQMQRADKEWEEARRKLMKERTTVLK